MRRILLLACATAPAVACTVSLRRQTRAAERTPPPVPAAIQVPAGHTLFLVGRGVTWFIE